MEVGSFSGAINAGRQGIANGLARMTRAATVLTHEIDVPAMIDLKLADVEARASAKVIHSVDESLGTLLDTLA